MKAIGYFSLFLLLILVFQLPCFNSKGNTIKNFVCLEARNVVFKYPVFDIQPFIGIPDSQLVFVTNQFKKIYPYTQLKQAISIPENAYYKPRNRYRADSIVRFLSKNTQINHVFVGLTNKDISTTKGSFADWGVMGLSYCPGNACVVSSYRLAKSNLLEQLFKVFIHEIGHTQGLEHCKNKTCYMRDAEGKNVTDQEIELCSDCIAFLKSKGWDFN